MGKKSKPYIKSEYQDKDYHIKFVHIHEGYTYYFIILVNEQEVFKTHNFDENQEFVARNRYEGIVFGYKLGIGNLIIP
jgi:hypothetical protein